MKKIIRAYKNMPLFQQFAVAFLAVILCPILCISVYSYYTGVKEIRQQYRDFFWQATGDINDRFASALTELDWLTLQIVNQEEPRKFVLSEADDYYARYKLMVWGNEQMFIKRILADRRYIGRVSIVGDGGVEYSFYGDSAQEYDKNLYDHKAIVDKAVRYQSTLPGDGKYQVFLSSLTEESHIPYLTVARRFAAGDYFHMSGTVFVEIQAGMLKQLLSNVNVRDGEVWILNEEGEIVYQTQADRIGDSAGQYFDMELFEEERDSFMMKREGESMFAAYTRNPSNGWVSVIEIPTNRMEQPVKNVKNVLLYTILIASPLTLLLGYLFVKSILEPVRSLEWYMRRMGLEEWEKIIGELPGNEIGMLMQEYNNMVDTMQELIEKAYKAELQQSQDKLVKRNAQLQALQTQINPHFLYNTLGAINTYALEADQREIEQMVNALGKMLRYAVQSPLEPVKIADEVEHLQNYLIIMEYRYKRMPQILWDLDSCIEQKILRLTIQPLVENVFQHAFVDGVKEGHCIKIRAQKDCELVVEVEDNGAGIPGMEAGRYYHLDEVPGVKFGIGLSNVDKRLQLIYGEGCGVIMFRNESGGTTIKLVLGEVTEKSRKNG